MRVAITVWGDRISPVFDASRHLLIARIERSRIITRDHQPFDPEKPSDLVKRLTILDVPVLICGAVSEFPATIITAGGITLIPFIAGEVDPVLGAYAQGRRLASTFGMPGCRDRHPVIDRPLTNPNHDGSKS